MPVIHVSTVGLVQRTNQHSLARVLSDIEVIAVKSQVKFKKFFIERGIIFLPYDYTFLFYQSRIDRN